MKDLIISLILVIGMVFLFGCENSSKISTKDLTYETFIKVYRCERGINSRLWILAQDANFNYDERILIIEDIVSIKGLGSWVVPKMRIEENRLIIPFPLDDEFKIRIGNQRHHLTKKVSK